MKLRRTRTGWGAAIFLPIGVYMLLVWSANGSWVSLLLGSGVVVMGGIFLWLTVRPFRFFIGPDGLDIRSGRLKTLIPWTSIETVCLVQPLPTASNEHPTATLQLVPVAGADLGLELSSSTPDGRASAQILSFNDVRDKPDRVAGALAQFGGSRFTDARIARTAKPAVPEFTIVLRGYDMDVVSDLITQAQQHLHSDRTADRAAFAVQLDSRDIPVQFRGYDRGQVDAYLDGVATALTSPDSK